MNTTQTNAAAIAEDVNAVVGRLIRRLRENATIGDYSPSQKAVLNRLEKEGPSTLANLARAEGMRPQSMAAIVAALTEAGFLEGTKDPSDRRQTIISITEAASADLRANRGARRDWLEQRIRTVLSTQEQRDLTAGIAALQRLLDT